MPSPLSQAIAELAKGLRTAQPGINPAELWQKGDLSYKLRPVQRKMASTLNQTGSLTKLLNCSRRIGKSFTALVQSTETLLLEKQVAIRFGAATQKSLRKIIHPLMLEICRDAPPHLRPIWRAQDGLYFFPSTQSELHISGCNNGHEEDLRGTAARRCVLDEAQLIKNLKYVVKDILMPQLLTTGGDLWILGTPPKTPAHEFVEYAQELKQKGSYAEYTIDQSGYPKEVIEQFAEEAGGRDSTTFKREYLCQFIVDSNFSIIPEWQDHFIQEYKPDEYYKFYLRYEGMDIGVRDLTPVLFATYDFKRAVLYVEDEFVINGPKMTTQLLAAGVSAKEQQLWGKLPVHQRVADNNNLILLQDLGLVHGLNFAPTSKDTIEAMVNNLRLWVGAGRVIVNPKCMQTIGSLKYGVWNDKRKDFERSSVFGHFDALAALIYLVRNIDTVTNPIPKGYGINPEKQYVPIEDPLTETEKMIKDIFTQKKRHP